MPSIITDPEIAAKIIIEILRDSLPATLLTIEAQWAADQVFDGGTIPADPLDLPAPDDELGYNYERLSNELKAEPLSPSIYIYPQRDDEIADFEQPEVSVRGCTLVLRLFAKGASPGMVERMIGRYADGVRRVLLTNTTLWGAATIANLTNGNYALTNDPLFGAIQYTIVVQFHSQWT